jgi:Zn finger protein HypA/HybF involved in hydrogenase expression
MSIRFRCKNCNQKYELDDDFAGDTLECGKCNTPMLVPPTSEIPLRTSAEKASIPASEQVAEASTPDRQPENASTSEDNVIVWCKSCGQKYNLSKELAGREGECAKCKKVFKVPVETEAKLSGMLSLLKQELLEKKNAPAKNAVPMPVSKPAPGAEPAESPKQDVQGNQSSASGDTTETAAKGDPEMPKRASLIGKFSLITDALIQHRIFQKMPRRIVTPILIFITLLLIILIALGSLKIYQMNATKATLQVKAIPAKQDQSKIVSPNNTPDAIPNTETR